MDGVYDICERSGIKGERITELSNYVGKVLLGILPLDELQEKLEKEMKIEKTEAKKIVREIFRVILYPVKSSLEGLYQIEIIPPTSVKETVKKEKKSSIKSKTSAVPKEKPTTPLAEEKSTTPQTTDKYREPIEE